MRQIDGKALEGVLDGAAIIVVDRGNLPAGAVFQHDALEEVVDVFHAKLEIHAFVAADLSFALVVADAAGIVL